MKRLALCLSLLVLVACGQKETSSKPVTTETTAATIAKQETRRFQYTNEVNGVTQTIVETLVYRGLAFETLGFEVKQPFDETTKASLQGQDFEQLKGALEETVEAQEVIKQLRQTEGVTLAVNLSSEEGVSLAITIDMKQVDLAALSQIQGLGVDFTELKQTTPEQYIALLEASGASEVTDSEGTTTEEAK